MKEKNFVVNFIVYFFRTLIVGFLPMAAYAYACHILGKVGTGSVEYIHSIATYFQLFATFGISSYAIREGAKIRDDKEKLDRFVNEMLAFNLVTLSISFVAFLSLFFINKFADYTTLLVIFAFFVVFCGLTLDWYYNVYEEYVYITIRTGISQLLAMVFLVLFLRSDRNWVYGISLVIPYIGMFLANIIGILKRTPIRLNKNVNFKKHIRPVALMFAIVISSSIYSLLDTTMLGLMRDDAAVGLYTASSKLTKLVIKLITALCAVFVPRLSYYIGIGDFKKFRSFAIKAINIVILLAIPCAFGLFIFSKESLVIFSGRDFVDASFAMKILAIDLIFSAIDGILGWQVLVPNKRDGILCIATFIGAAIDCIFNLILIPRYYIEGAAVATLISELCVFVICVYYCRQYVDMKQVLSHSVKCTVASLPIIGIGYGLINFTTISPTLVMVIAVPSSMIFYGLILFVIRDELLYNLLDMLKHKRGK